jgi:hypothetical protein
MIAQIVRMTHMPTMATVAALMLKSLGPYLTSPVRTLREVVERAGRLMGVADRASVKRAGAIGRSRRA